MTRTLFISFLLLAATVRAAGTCDYFFSQLAYSDQLGTCSGLTIKSHGCALTCVAMLHEWESGSAADPNPSALNLWLKNHAGFEGGCDILWWVAADYDGASGLTWLGRTDTRDDWSALDAELAASRRPIVKVDATPTTPDLSSHFVIVYDRVGASGVPNSYRILDPRESACAPTRTLESYRDPSSGYVFFGMRTFGGNFPMTTTFSLRWLYVATGLPVVDGTTVSWGPYHQQTSNGWVTFANVPCASYTLSISGLWVWDQSFGAYSPCTTTSTERTCERGDCSGGQTASAMGEAGFGLNDRVEVYNTGDLGLRAWTNTCSGTYAVKHDQTQGTVLSSQPTCCGGYNRWLILWDGDSSARWSAEGDAEANEYWLRKVDPATVATPVISPNGGTYSQSVEIEMEVSTPGATIYYTTNGNTPTASSIIYNEPFMLNGSSTIKAKAFKTSMVGSETASATFTITPQSAKPLITLNETEFIVTPTDFSYGDNFRITNTGQADLNFTITTDRQWLTVNQVSGHLTPGEIDHIRTDWLLADLPSGQHSGFIRIADPNADDPSVRIRVELNLDWSVKSFLRLDGPTSVLEGERLRFCFEPNWAVGTSLPVTVQKLDGGDADLVQVSPDLHVFTAENYDFCQFLEIEAQQDDDQANGQALFRFSSPYETLAEVAIFESDDDVPNAPLIDPVWDHSTDTETMYRVLPSLRLGRNPVVDWVLVTGPGQMTIDSQTGEVFWAEPFVQGPYATVTIRATNTLGQAEETWNIYTLSNPRAWWEQLSGIGAYACIQHAMAYDSLRNLVFLVGGSCASEHRRDASAWNGDARSWQLLATTGPEKYDHALAYDESRDRLVLYGGAGSKGNETWEYDPTTNAWTMLTTAGPGQRRDLTMAYDSLRSRMLIFSGRVLNNGGAAPPNDVWEWNGSRGSWLQVPTINGPLGREGHSFVYDSLRDKMILFGGYANGIYFGDTWELDLVSNTWNLRSTSGPAPRVDHSCAFDSSRRRAVLFGGNDATLTYGDIWEWDGNGWELIADGNVPKREHAMAFDTLRHELVLFGGEVPKPGIVERLGDTSILVIDTDRDGVPDYDDQCSVTILGSPVNPAGCPIVSSDVDHDGDVDLQDFDELYGCLTGPDVERWPGCGGKDLQGDGYIDISDFAGQQCCFSGADMPAATTCDD